MDYIETVKKRRLENRQMMSALGVFSAKEDFKTSLASAQLPENSTPRGRPKKSVKASTPRASSSSQTSSQEVRRSGRLQGREAPKYADVEEFEEISRKRKIGTRSSSTPTVKTQKFAGPNTFGAIPGVAIGTEYDTRLAASHAGIHRPTVAGIHGNPAEGCYSIALSGGYEDDVDLGESFMYTGEGGRDLKGTKANPKNLRTAAQSKDQVLERGNLALSKNVENQLPVRVLRGYKLNSKYAPEKGYRYDGLYNVVNFYREVGKSGFAIYKFEFQRIKDQEPAPWLSDLENEELGDLQGEEIKIEGVFSLRDLLDNPNENKKDAATSVSADSDEDNIDRNSAAASQISSEN